MVLIDSHCHIFKQDYEDIDKVINDSNFNLVKYVINNGSNGIFNREVIELVGKYPNMYGAIGIHPEDVDSYTMEDIKFIEDNISNKKIVAIGEIGLDYHYTKDNREEQIKLLEMQLDLATKYNIPVIIHSRDATLDTINVLKKYHLRGTIHSFSGSLETAKEYINMGYMLGVNGVITFKNCKIKEVIKEIGLEHVVLETDSPYLTPEPYRGNKNSPKHILDIAKFVANLFNTSIEEVADITTNNVKKIYPKIKIDNYYKN